MRRNLILPVLLIFALGFGRVTQQKQVLAKVNNYEITFQEFKQELQDSAYAGSKTYESKKEFLDNIISRKLILQEAERRGLDKDEKFLKVIEKFWEQALLKVALDEKSKEIAGAVLVSDQEVEEAYQKMLVEAKIEKPYDSAYSQIKWEITRAKQTQLIDKWIAELYQKSKIKIDSNLLKD